jgi:large subunit ribosomal protein L5
MERLRAQYLESVVPALREKFEYGNVMEVPRITKVTLNMGLGDAVADKKVIEHALSDMTAIAGQKPVVTKASPTSPKSAMLRRFTLIAFSP